MPTFITGFIRPQSVVYQYLVDASVALPSQSPILFIGAGKLTKAYYRSTTEKGALITREDTSGLSSGEDLFYSGSALTSANLTTTIIDEANNEYEMGTDWSLVVVGTLNYIQWLSVSGARSPDSGVQYVVNFEIPKDPLKDYNPQLFTSLSSQYTWSGTPGYAYTTGAREVNGSPLINGVGWGAYFAKQNNVGQWYSLELNPYDEDTIGTEGGPTLIGGGSDPSEVFTTEANLKIAFTQALAKSLKVAAWGIIPCFPMTTTHVSSSAQYTVVNSSLVPVFKSHIKLARGLAHQRFRVGLAGAPLDAEIGVLDPTLLFKELAAAFSLNAFAVIAPSTAKYTINSIQSNMDGSMIAAALGGVLSNPSYDPGEPIFNKELAGFDDIEDPFDGQQKDTMLGAGVLVVDKETFGIPAIVFDATTAPDEDADSQLKFMRVRDYISVSLNTVLNRLAIGMRNFQGEANTEIKRIITSVLTKCVQMKMINSFTDPVVSQNSSEKRQVDVNVTIYLTPDVVWIYNKLGVAVGS